MTCYFQKTFISAFCVILFAYGDCTAVMPKVVSHCSTSKISTNPCNRDRACVAGESLRCEFIFHVEWFVTMSAECGNCPDVSADCDRNCCIPGSNPVHGKTGRPVIVANRQLPGPAIEVCLGDTVSVNVINDMRNGDMISIHWHGMDQKKSTYMDGVPMVTQYPIPPGHNLTYEFKANAAGTFFWHSHYSMQRGDGLAGAVVIRQPEITDPHRDIFDSDDLPPLVLQDWLPNETSESLWARYAYGFSSITIPEIMINGRTGDKPETIRIFEVRHPNPRMRFISNAFSTCILNVKLDDHIFIVIASDGNDIQAVATKSLNILSGERFDMVPKYTGSSPPKNNSFYLRVSGSNQCAISSSPNLPYTAKAILKYDKVPDRIPLPTPLYDEINSINKPKATPGVAILGELKSLTAVSSEYMGTPVVVPVEMGFAPDSVAIHSTFKDGVGLPRLNGITFTMPKAPLLIQGLHPNDKACNVSNPICKDPSFCECVHIHKVKTGSLVEMRFIDNGRRFRDANHPMHLHGFTFRVVAMDQVKSSNDMSGLTNIDIDNMDRAGKIARNFERSPIKDTVSVPSGGYTLVRFIADNPGYWLLHCHIEYHMEFGMAMIIQVGEQNEFPKPPDNFLTCSYGKNNNLEPGNGGNVELPGFRATSFFLYTLYFIASNNRFQS